MRGFLQPAVKPVASESQQAFRTLSRARRNKVAKTAQTTLIKADQWARGDAITSELADALERALKDLKAKPVKKS
ncbi:MAG: hypothetical protein JWM74_658 [Myxococcaceae bacterium]|nr:hypothetical protein [Myxococcaceae bacterium]